MGERATFWQPTREGLNWKLCIFHDARTTIWKKNCFVSEIEQGHDLGPGNRIKLNHPSQAPSPALLAGRLSGQAPTVSSNEGILFTLLRLTPFKKRTSELFLKYQQSGGSVS